MTLRPADWTLTLKGRPEAAPVQSVLLAAGLRGGDIRLVPDRSLRLGAQLHLHRDGREDLVLADLAAMLELIEDLHPDQPLHPRDPGRRASHREALGLVPLLARRVEAVLVAADAQALDLAIHLLGDSLRRLERHGEQGKQISLLDLALLPLLWRILVLDRHHATMILVSFPTLRDRALYLLGRAELAYDFDADAEAALVDGLRLVQPALARPELRPDWTNALGPAARRRPVGRAG